MNLLSIALGKNYRQAEGEGSRVLLAPVADGGGSVDACRELCCTKDHLQCLVSMMQLKLED